jgi:hypothetical protein
MRAAAVISGLARLSADAVAAGELGIVFLGVEALAGRTVLLLSQVSVTSQKTRAKNSPHTSTANLPSLHIPSLPVTSTSTIPLPRHHHILNHNPKSPLPHPYTAHPHRHPARANGIRHCLRTRSAFHHGTLGDDIGVAVTVGVGSGAVCP